MYRYDLKCIARVHHCHMLSPPSWAPNPTPWPLMYSLFPVLDEVLCPLWIGVRVRVEGGPGVRVMVNVGVKVMVRI